MSHSGVRYNIEELMDRGPERHQGLERPLKQGTGPTGSCGREESRMQR